MSKNSEQLPVSSEDSLQSSELSPRGESLDENGAGTHKLCLKVPPDDSQVSQKTQGVKVSRDNGIGILQSAAKKAAASNSRGDVHEYMRLRRNYV